MKKLVSVKDVCFGYENELVLKNVNLDIYEGDYLGIVGPNGSGKSTLIKIMLNILKPSKGSIEMFGKNIDDFRDWGKIGYVRQKATSFNTGFPATVEEIVAANLFSRIGIFKPITRSHREMVYKALEIVEMEKFNRKLIGNLSGGQQQKVFIARALVNSPEILFLDEPTVGIDLDSQREFYGLMEKLNKEMHITIVMVSHDIGVITEKVNRFACMGDSRLICHTNNSHLEITDILKEVYGDKMNLLIHRH
ncbi:MAG: Zinc ABC transporter, ATP-binding protein ZnuC [Firmicutes bacterium]|nr:Zinc ABC transporter, ATP-binding protein ZnuC [Bacillota bacterium]MDI6707037.1 metal ABC transporter ATP-binding protein [Bacillota bacterium]